MTTWLGDTNGNRSSVEFWGSKEAAQAALDSLKECENCINCSRCSRCSDCSGCSRCSYCSDCSNCSRCSGCSRCSYCSDCSNCSRCSDCSRCSNCSDLKNSKPTVEPNLLPVPVIPNIHQAVFAAAANPRALNMRDWHSCKNTHCRAGWVVTLAGEAGRALEEFHNTELAAMMIYGTSSPIPVNPSRFYDDNEEALADMKRLADEEASAAE